MKLQEVKQRLSEIEAEIDDERQCVMELRLLYDFIRHVEASTGPELASMAQEVLKVESMEFLRYQ